METLKPPPQTLVPLLLRTDRLASLPSLHLVRAQDGAPPRLRTSVRVGWRDGALLVRFDGRDDGRVATKTRRDDALWEEDVFEVFVSPQDPPHLYFEFEVNPLGTLFDAAIVSPRLSRPTICVDVLWDCPGYRARVRRTEKRWSALLTIPLVPLCEGPLPSVWRANFFRVDRGAGHAPDEYSAWSPANRQPPDFHDATRFGTLQLEGA
ncbi:MAG TPA: carbohydrate-binding family 9-like protein [Thermoanaerobaculia bacterium]|nr:carbohydrate-binding family 9-like protein [Thermoanaerobaculia bacterium]